MSIQIAQTDEELTHCHPVIVQLRPHLALSEFLRRVRVQQAEGYQLAVRRDATGRVVACAGYRFLHLLHRGKVLYVDDLVSDAAERSSGHGHALIDWLVEQATAAGCAEVQLDSGTHRHEAHRFYFRERFHVTCYHFSRPLEKSS